MQIYVCDALCGQGKTQACINMINKDEAHKYIVITPYLTEVERIKNACACRDIASPEQRTPTGYSKFNDLVGLLRAGRNIASTHALFYSYTDEVKELIRAQGYILVLDEVLDLFQPLGMDGGDVDFLVRNGIASKNDDMVLWEDDAYNGAIFHDVKRMSKSRNLVDYDGSFYFWVMPIDLFECFSKAYVLTYMFEHQLLRHFFEANNLPYELIGVKKVGDEYRYCDLSDMDRRIDLTDKILITRKPRYDEIGNEAFSLSAGWLDRAAAEPGQPKLKKLKSNLYNIFRDPNIKSTDKMWTTLNRYRNALKGKGYSNGFITFNKRATNDFAGKHYLAYCLNVYMMPWMKNYLHRIGAKSVNQDMYALSVLIQWIFRSAVRNGEAVHIYLPSKRMRYLLTQWLKNLKEGKDLNEIRFALWDKIDYTEAGYALKKSKKTKEGKKR